MTGWDAIVFVVGNATQAAHYYQAVWGWNSSPTPARRTQPRPQGLRPEVRLDQVRRQGCGQPRQPAHRPPRQARRRCCGHRPRGPRRGPLHRAGPACQRDHPREPHDIRTSSAPSGWRRSRPTARLGTRWSSSWSTGSVCRPARPGVCRPHEWFRQAEGAPKRLFQALDHVVGNVELGKMDDWVAFYNKVMGFREHGRIRRRRHRHRLLALMSKVVANGNHRVKFPSTSRRSPRSAARSTSTSTSTPVPAPSIWRSQPTTSSTPSTGCAPKVWSSSTRRTPTTGRRVAGPDRRGPGAGGGVASARSSSTVTRTAICCRSSPSRWVIGRRSSSRSSSGTGRWASAGELQGLFGASSASRTSAATSEPSRRRGPRFGAGAAVVRLGGMSEQPTSAGWFDDPENPDQLRYFDGILWTRTSPQAHP